jgi:hypothetical protein
VSVAADLVIDALAELDGAIRQAGLDHVDGNDSAALAELEDASHTLDDLVADLRRDLADPEPA